MKKMPWPIFPLLFALLTLAFFLFLYQDSPDSPDLTGAWLVFLTALGWSVLIVLGRNRARQLKMVFASSIVLASVALIEIFRPFPVDPLQHRLMVALQALGMAGIALYLHILKKKGENAHD